MPRISRKQTDRWRRNIYGPSRPYFNKAQWRWIKNQRAKAWGTKNRPGFWRQAMRYYNKPAGSRYRRKHKYIDRSRYRRRKYW